MTLELLDFEIEKTRYYTKEESLKLGYSVEQKITINYNIDDSKQQLKAVIKTNGLDEIIYPYNSLTYRDVIEKNKGLLETIGIKFLESPKERRLIFNAHEHVYELQTHRKIFDDLEEFGTFIKSAFKSNGKKVFPITAYLRDILSEEISYIDNLAQFANTGNVMDITIDR